MQRQGTGFLREWHITAGLGGFFPFTFNVEGNTSPLGFVAGATTGVYTDNYGLVARYNYHRVGILPADLQEVDSGDNIEALPIRKDLPLDSTAHTISLSPSFAYPTGNGRRFAALLYLDLGGFYEWGQINRKKFDIKALSFREEDIRVLAESSHVDYQVAGLRLGVGPAFDIQHFLVGLHLLLDAGVPLDGDDLGTLDKYLWRIIFSVNWGYRKTFR